MSNTLECELEDESYECAYCKREFSNEDTCVDHVRECKRVINSPITFSKIASKNAEKPVEYAINMICRYIQQQVNLKRTNADFPISKFYSKSIAEISECVIRHMSMKKLTFCILSDSSSQYICRAEWKE